MRSVLKNNLRTINSGPNFGLHSKLRMVALKYRLTLNGIIEIRWCRYFGFRYSAWL